MKKSINLALLAAIAASCTTQNEYNLSGEITGLKNDTVLVFANDPVNRKSICIDTVAVSGNKFSTKLPDEDLLYLSILEKPKNNEALRMISTPPFILLKGEKLKVSGSIDNLHASGTEIYNELTKAEKINKYQDDIISINSDFTKIYQSKDSEKLDSIRQVLIDTSKKLSKEKLEYIKNNPNSIASGYLYLNLSLDCMGEAKNILGENVKNGPLAKLIKMSTDMYETEMAKRKAKENIASGKPAPEFRLKNIDNEEMTLASFHGKYVLLDFWGTWCGWCIKGMPEMKKYYDKYKSKMEIVGINCGDTEEKWRKGVKELELPWTNLYNGSEKEIIINYAVSGYPTKILIDSKGNIVDVFVGETKALYKKLDELFK